MEHIIIGFWWTTGNISSFLATAIICPYIWCLKAWATPGVITSPSIASILEDLQWMQSDENRPVANYSGRKWGIAILTESSETHWGSQNRKHTSDDKMLPLFSWRCIYRNLVHLSSILTNLTNVSSIIIYIHFILFLPESQFDRF